MVIADPIGQTRGNRLDPDRRGESRPPKTSDEIAFGFSLWAPCCLRRWRCPGRDDCEMVHATTKLKIPMARLSGMRGQSLLSVAVGICSLAGCLTQPPISAALQSNLQLLPYRNDTGLDCFTATTTQAARCTAQRSVRAEKFLSSSDHAYMSSLG